ncbi:MAG: NFACT RNA binding domain-containing protein [Myxococcota bacterium]
MSERPSHGGRVQRVDGPAPGCVCLGVRRTGETLFIVLDEQGVRRADARPRGEPADGFIKRLRNLLVGTHVVAEGKPLARRLRFAARDGGLYLVHERRRIVLRDEQGRVRAARQRLAHGNPIAEASTVGFDELPIYVRSEASDKHIHQRLAREIKRLQHTRAKIEGEAERGRVAPALRHDADLLMAAAEAREENGQVSVLDWLTGETRTIELGAAEGRARTRLEAAEAFYRRAKRFERGVGHARHRLGEVDARLSELVEARRQLDAGEDAATVFARIGLRLLEAGPRGREKVGERRPYREFRSGERRILVGRSARDNDTLTLRVAKPHDHWLHARGVPGSHVVVPMAKGETIGANALRDAALLALHFSSTDEGDVIHTPRRYVRKPRGAAVGAVQIVREKVIRLRRDDGRLRELLKGEIR